MIPKTFVTRKQQAVAIREEVAHEGEQNCIFQAEPNQCLMPPQHGLPTPTVSALTNKGKYSKCCFHHPVYLQVHFQGTGYLFLALGVD
ncbi:uncharacterized protein LOC122543601 isoform X2 [Chiloscyllium plagiosum]|uniref:uncharacterized protein LOC122543601 isoform X2 n=1 Tax=Chiloscyllium plagiosum TaxID=36176 RepID=UPI001CB8332B|nr:uncharacterized protein LOC122543601 isoform X2 [Chiloscyllium plagiosum]